MGLSDGTGNGMTLGLRLGLLGSLFRRGLGFLRGLRLHLLGLRLRLLGDLLCLGLGLGCLCLACCLRLGHLFIELLLISRCFLLHFLHHLSSILLRRCQSFLRTVASLRPGFLCGSSLLRRGSLRRSRFLRRSLDLRGTLLRGCLGLGLGLLLGLLELLL